MEEINANNYLDKIHGNHAVINFYETSCSNCQIMEPTINDLERAFPHIKFLKVNVDRNPELAQRFAIEALPTLILVKNGQYLPPIVGLKPYNFLAEKIKNL